MDYQPATKRQIELLYKLLPLDKHTLIPTMTTDAAHLMISRYYATGDRFSPTSRQEYYLRNHGLWREGLTREEANELIAAEKQKERSNLEGP